MGGYSWNRTLAVRQKAAWLVRRAARAGFAVLLLTACGRDEPSTGAIVGPVGGAVSQIAPEDTGTYLVLLNVHKSNAEAVSRAIVAAERGRQRYLYRSLSGFAISGINDAAAARIAQDPRVRLVERDQKGIDIGRPSVTGWR